MKKLLSVVLMFACILTLAACSTAPNNFAGGGPMYGAPNYDMSLDYGSLIGKDSIFMPGEEPSDDEIDQWIEENLGMMIENQFVNTADENVSTFSADVDTGSYTYFRKLVNAGYSWDYLKSVLDNSTRTEEMINYFMYDYKTPENGELFGVDPVISACPWNPNSYLMTIGLATEKTEVSVANNLVFLIDVSGSMNSSDKLGLLKKAFNYLVDQLDSNDTVSIVTYSGGERVVLDGTNGSLHTVINLAVDLLQAGGSTNGQAGLQKAYEIARKHYIEGGNNRIIMASDGDLNVGISSPEELKNYVSEMRDNGVYLSTMGFGSGNYRDDNMETLADNGNGVYYYIDSEAEAEKVFGTDIFSTLYTVAEDVKLQLEFNPEVVKSYRLIGYENRVMNKEDFEDDTKDAGELGAGHTVTVCYELVMQDEVDDGEWMKLNVRYKNPGEDTSNLNTYSIGSEDYTESVDDDFKFISAVIEFSMLLRDSKYAEGLSLEDVAESLYQFSFNDDEYKRAFADMVAELAGVDSQS